MATQPTIGASALAHTTQNAILDELRQSLVQQTYSATFALGGKVPISREDDASTPCPASGFKADINVLRPSKPVHIRFGESGLGRKLVLPAAYDSAELQQLVQACSPASFGRNGKDVHDPSYRKAGKLDTTDFATTFCPYESGIIDVVNQVLVTNPRWGTRAELYKLNMYSAPSGFFKPHVDTPRGEKQFGSLVVSMPVEHEGKEEPVKGVCSG
jgi:hypothetical protein